MKKQLMAETKDDASESVSEAGSGRGRKSCPTDRPDPLVEKMCEYVDGGNGNTSAGDAPRAAGRTHALAFVAPQPNGQKLNVKE